MGPRCELLSARGVTRSFGTTAALLGVDVDVAAGEILAVCRRRPSAPCRARSAGSSASRPIPTPSSGPAARWSPGATVDLSTAALRTATASESSVRLGRVVLGAMPGTFVVAGCSAAVAAATGLLERRRSFALLRLAGVPVSVLRRSAVLALAAPLVVAAVLAALLGVVTGRLVGLGRSGRTRPLGDARRPARGGPAGRDGWAAWPSR